MTNDIYDYLVSVASKARAATGYLCSIDTDVKNYALTQIAENLLLYSKDIIKANKQDIENAIEAGIKTSLLDRLSLDEKRIEAMANSIKKVVGLPDPTGISDGWSRPNGLKIERRRVPIGVIGIIYEARPNVTVDAAALCIKSGNAVILRGGKAALESNKVICKVIDSTLRSCGFPDGCVNLIESPDRSYTVQLLKLSGYIDVIIPRGGKDLIKSVKENATVPVIETGAGNCHLYVHNDGDLEIAKNILVNAKTQRPSVCNAIETLLVHKDIAEAFLPIAKSALDAFSVELRGCDETIRILGDSVLPATEEDYFTEYNDFIISIKVVDDLDEAIAHINKYNTKHSEAIVTKSIEASNKFSVLVDAAAVYTNASTRFTDGEEFGFGAEIGISTQKLHARGPMGLNELTCAKYFIQGNGQIR